MSRFYPHSLREGILPVRVEWCAQGEKLSPGVLPGLGRGRLASLALWPSSLGGAGFPRAYPHGRAQHYGRAARKADMYS